MKNHLYRWALAGAHSLVACAAIHSNASLAQTPTPTLIPTGNALPFKSTLEKYKSYTDEKIVPWKAANDEVGRIGGWRTYLKEANEPDPPETTEAKPIESKPVESKTAPPRVTNPHAGHGSKQ
jgi:hypothetical protein